MNKVKMFFVAAALVLTTAGVFAGKAKFLESINAYVTPTATPGSSYIQITSGAVSFSQLTSTAGGSNDVAQITDRNGVSYYIYKNTGTNTYVPVYSTSAF